MASVKLTNVQKVYDNKVIAVNDFNLEIKDKEFVVFVGPSGCGKSTTLRMIAGLEEISGGTIEIDGEVVNDLQPKDRNIAMVFQNYALYPHMTVYDNIAFSLRIKKLPEEEVYARVTNAAEILGISQTVYSPYERGYQTIPVIHLLALADYYQTSTDYLLGRTNIKTPYRRR